jgi:hypothetical protein
MAPDSIDRAFEGIDVNHPAEHLRLKPAAGLPAIRGR